MDVIVASIVLVLTAPVVATAIVAVKISSRGPALRSEIRLGRHGVPFKMLGLRTTVADGTALAAERSGPKRPDHLVITRSSDSRLTGVGRALRTTSIDELPRFWNVLRGDLSIIGPCPRRAHEMRHPRQQPAPSDDVRPGLTGLWRLSHPALDHQSPMPGGRASV